MAPDAWVAPDAWLLLSQCALGMAGGGGQRGHRSARAGDSCVDLSLRSLVVLSGQDSKTPESSLPGPGFGDLVFVRCVHLFPSGIVFFPFRLEAS